MVENGIDFDKVITAGRISDEVKDLVIRVATESVPHVADGTRTMMLVAGLGEFTGNLTLSRCGNFFDFEH